MEEIEIKKNDLLWAKLLKNTAEKFLLLMIIQEMKIQKKSETQL